MWGCNGQPHASDVPGHPGRANAKEGSVMAVDVVEALQKLIQSILSDRDTAVQFVEDGEGMLAAQGITEGNLEGLDMRQIVSDSCTGMDLPDSVRGAVQNYSGGGSSGGGYSSPPPGPASGVDQVMQHLNYVTYVAYEGDDYISQEITNIDQSQNVDVDVDGDVHGGFDLDVDSHDVNANATGDGSAASGFGPATSGDENLVNTGVNLGQQNTGDNAAQGVALGGDVVQNTGEFAGIQAGGNVDASESAMGFGSGDTTANSTDINAPVIGSSVTSGGDAFNQVGNTVQEGAAQSQGGDAVGIKTDDDFIDADGGFATRDLADTRREFLSEETGSEGEGDGGGAEGAV